MTSENAARKPYSPAAVQRGIHLVHSQDWPVETRASVRMMVSRSEQRRRESRATHLLLDPLAWAGGVMLRWMRGR